MRYLKTYEGLFDFFKKKEKEPVIEKSEKECCEEITQDIIDSMWDIFDKYDINDSSTIDKWQLNVPGTIEWKYNYTLLNNGERVKNGIMINNIPGKETIKIELFNDIINIIPVIEARSGIKLFNPRSHNTSNINGASVTIVIDFPMYIASNTKRRSW